VTNRIAAIKAALQPRASALHLGGLPVLAPASGWSFTHPVRELLLNDEIHPRVIGELVPSARRFLWIITADIKDMHVARGKRAVPFLQVLAERVEEGVGVRLIHAKEPGPRFRADFDRHPVLVESDLFERVLCPRVHTKAVVADGKRAFIGSPNLTGAGMGAKHADKRNFEAGFLTDEAEDLRRIVRWVDELFIGEYCGRCRLRDRCPDPLDRED
jgi:phosphatidylserine/phosphatidylglycerophosphate/cardiolipin synthase-like enzyme